MSDPTYGDLMLSIKSKDKIISSVLDKVTQSKFPELTWVGKDYSKKDLIDDLRVALEVKGE
jgi:hypothetical protein